MVQLRKEGPGREEESFYVSTSLGVCAPERESRKVIQINFGAEPLSLDIFPSPCLWVGVAPVDGSVVLHSTHKP